LDTIKLLGVDLNDNQVYSETKKIIDQWIQRLNKIA
jgi:oligoendopeptidase F